MLNCLTYIAFVYWAVATVHTILPVDVAVCGAGAVRGGLGALFKHAFGGDLDVDIAAWRGFPCNSGLLTKFAFILRRPAATVRHIMYGGGQDEPFVPILFVVPLVFGAIMLLRRLGLHVMSFTSARTLLKFGVALGCRTVIILHSLAYPTKESVYFKRYSKVEFCIIAWTAYIIELPVWHEALVSGGTAVTVLLLCALFPHHMLPEVNPINVATQAVAAAAFGVGHAHYLQRRRSAQRAAARASRAAAKAAAAAAAAAAEEEEEQQLLLKAARHGASTSTGAATKPAAAATTGDTTAAAEAAPPQPPLQPQPAAAQPVAFAAASATPGPAAAAASLAALRRIHSMAGRSYVSPARPCRFAIKIQHAHLSDLPPDVVSVINSEVLAGSGWQAVSAHAREGCIELVLDLRPLLPPRPSYGNGGAAAAAADDRRAQPDQDRPEADDDDGGANGPSGGGDGDGAAPFARMDPAALRDLGRSIVSYLHHTGVIQPDREQSIVLQMDQDTVTLKWNPETEAWGLLEDASAEAEPPAPPTPVLLYVSPRVAAWPGGGGGVRLHLTAQLVGPSAEEVLAGGGIVVRTGSGSLSYSVVHVRPQRHPAAPLEVELAVLGPPASGLLLVEARSSAGLLSAPLPVVVDRDAVVVSGLAAVMAEMDDSSVDAFLHDYGSWLDLAAARTLAAKSAHDAPDVGGRAGGGGGDRVKGAPPPPAAATTGSAGGDGGGGSASAIDGTMQLVAADLLRVCCQGAAADASVAAAVDRLIDCVLACDDSRPPVAALAALLDAVQVPPSGAGALHMAIAAGSRLMVEVLVRWHERLAGTAAALQDPWLGRASCGITPLHVAAAMPDGGAMAAWLLRTYDAAAAAWDAAAAASDDGLTPAGLAAQLGGRWWLRVGRAGGAAARAVRRALAAPPPSLGRAAELLLGFRDRPLERRFAEAVSGQTVVMLALYALVYALLPLFSLAKAAQYGSSGTALALLALHLPHTAPFVAWVWVWVWVSRQGQGWDCDWGCFRSAAVAAAAAMSLTSAPAAAKPTHASRLPPARPPRPPAAHRLLGCSGGPISARRLRSAFLAMHLCRAAAKAAVGLSLWPFALPGTAEAAFVARGGDIALEAVVRPLLEQVGLPARLVVSLVDGPATWLLYRGLERQRPGLVPRPLQRVMLYQVVLLATTAAVSAANRARFLRTQEVWRKDTRWAGAAAAAAAATAVAAAAAAGSSGASAVSCGGGGVCAAAAAAAAASGSGGKGGKARPLSRTPSDGGGGKGPDLAATVAAAAAAAGGDKSQRCPGLRGDDQMATGGAGGAAATSSSAGADGCRVHYGWTWLRGTGTVG